MPLRILVVDDELHFRRLAQAILQRAGYSVVVAASLPEIVPAIYRSEVDLVLMDVSMPGISGDAIVSIINQTVYGRRIPIFLVSNLPEESLREKAEAAGATGWCQKPLTAAKIQVIVDQAQASLKPPRRFDAQG